MEVEDYITLSKSIIKCGEILSLNDEIFYLCQFCGSCYSESETALNHIFTEHKDKISIQTKPQFIQEFFSIEKFEDEGILYNDTHMDEFPNDQFIIDETKIAEEQDSNDDYSEEDFWKTNTIPEETQPTTIIKMIKCDCGAADCDENFKKEIGIIFCLTCKEHISVESFNEHKETCIEAKSGSFGCKICLKTYTTEKGLQNHLKKFHSNEKSINENSVNDLVTENSVNKNSVNENSVNENSVNQNNISHICRFCNMKLKNKLSLKYHEQLHNPKTLKCNYCDAKFSSRESLRNHKKNVHAPKEYICEKCGNIFNCRKKFSRHKAVHSEERRYKCEFCNATFKRLSSLWAHRHNHTKTKIYKCKLCEKVMHSYMKTYNHYRDNHGVTYSTAYETGECDAPPYENKNKKQRVGELQETKFFVKKIRTCKICSKQFDNFESTYGHYKSHNIKYSNAYERGECDGKMTKEEINKYTCKICNKYHKSFNSVNRHMLGHHGVRFSVKINDYSNVVN